MEQRGEGTPACLPQTGSAVGHQMLGRLLTHLLAVLTSFTCPATQALNKDLTNAEKAQGRAGLLMPPGRLPAQAGEKTGTFFSDKQQ